MKCEPIVPYTSAQLEGLRQGSSPVEGTGIVVTWADVELVVVGCAPTMHRTCSVFAHLNWRP